MMVPEPPQVGQVLKEVPFLAPVPLHGASLTNVGILRVLLTPEAMSARVILMVMRRSVPRRC